VTPRNSHPRHDFRDVARAAQGVLAISEVTSLGGGQIDQDRFPLAGTGVEDPLAGGHGA